MKIWFSSHNIITNVGRATNTFEAQSRNMMNICTKYGFDSLIISGSYDGHRRHMTDEQQQTTPGLWLKLPTGELKIYCKPENFHLQIIFTKLMKLLPVGRPGR